MGMTITEKILARAGGTAKVSPGDVAVVDVETACLIDLSFLPEGWREVLKVADPSKVMIVFDHLAPAPTVAAAEIMQTGREFAKRFGIERVHDIGRDQGISHAIIADNAYAPAYRQRTSSCTSPENGARTSTRISSMADRACRASA